MQPVANYSTSTGLFEVVVYYKHDGGKGDGTFLVDFVSGTYSADEVAAYNISGERGPPARW